MSFMYDEVGDYASTVWFFAVELDDYKYVDKVTFTGFLNGTQICCWEIPLDASVPVLGEVNDDTPEPVKLPKATAKLKVKKEEEDTK
ncbi:MAG: peroxidase [Saprospiraceae bacterium]|nr:peroxidase [Saprospiraceae bacterium]